MYRIRLLHFIDRRKMMCGYTFKKYGSELLQNMTFVKRTSFIGKRTVQSNHDVDYTVLGKLDIVNYNHVNCNVITSLFRHISGKKLISISTILYWSLAKSQSKSLYYSLVCCCTLQTLWYMISQCLFIILGVVQPV